MAKNNISFVSTHATNLLNVGDDPGWLDEGFLTKIDELCGGQTQSLPLNCDVAFRLGDRTTSLTNALSPSTRLETTSTSHFIEKKTPYYPSEAGLEKSIDIPPEQCLGDGFTQS